MSEIPVGLDDFDAPLWGVAKIAEAVRLNRRQTYHLLETGELPATKVGRRWVSTRRRLQARLNGGEAG